MQDIPSTPPSAPLSFAHRSEAVTQAISQQFADRPTLRPVVEQQLRERLQEHYPPLVVDMRTLKLATPNQQGGWDLKLLIDVALSYLGSGAALNLTAAIDERRCFLTQQTPVRLTYEANGPRELDMAVIENAITELCFTLSIGFQQALTDYWNRNADTGTSRWQWLGDLLADNLSSTATLLPDTHSETRDILNAVTRRPDRRERQADAADFVYAYCLEACVLNQGVSARQLSTDILLVRGTHVLLCTISGDVESFSSMEAFTRIWGQRLERQLSAESILVNRYEPEGNLFDIQAALLLSQQLDDLDTLPLPVTDGVHALEERFADATNPVIGFGDAPAPDPTHQARIRTALPQWLTAASADDRFAYRQHMLEQARLQQQTAGASFLDGVENLHDFAARTLREQLHRDHPESLVEPRNLELTFHVPVGDLRGGYVTPVTMSMVELAIKNLAGAPLGRMTLRDTTGAAVPAWLTADYVLGEKGVFRSTTGLISQVDIGRRYPESIREWLLGDSAEAHRREVLFGEELTLRLPLQALEHKIRGQHGFTSKGYRYVKAVLQRSAPGRVVDAQDIVIRPLAFARTPGAHPDIAANMFIIEPRDTEIGPHLLYRPLYGDSLQQFANRAALLEAIATPGPLQDSVLAWLSDSARPIYDHDGFRSPHILRFGLGDDTVQWPAPPPAQLVHDVNGSGVSGSLSQALAGDNLTQYLYGSNACALVDLADRDSVSNAESRWAILLEGGWLLFNALLMPLLQGPAMWVGWMVQLAVSLEHDLAALHGDDASARELAWVDVLLNIGLILLHLVSRESPVRTPRLHPLEPRLPLTLAALRRPPGASTGGPTARIEQGPVGLPAEPPAGDKTLVDFIHSNARDASRRRLLDALKELHVPWPVPAPEPVQIGDLKGLYRLDRVWHASVAGLLFRVAVEPRSGVVYLVHPQKPQHPGFQLTRNAKGQWTLDLGLKLRGGGPKVRADARREAIYQKRNLASAEINRISTQISDQIRQLKPIDVELDAARLQFELIHNQLGVARKKLRAAAQDPALIADLRSKVAQRSRAKTSFRVQQERFELAATQLSTLRREAIKAYGELRELDRQFDYEDQCANQYLSILATDEMRVSQLSSLYLATFASEQGESLLELQGTARDIASRHYFLDLLETNFAASEQHAQAMIAIESTLEEMVGNLKTGAAQRIKYLKGHPMRKYYTRLNALLESLDVLTELSVDLTIPATTPQEQYFLDLHQKRLFTLSSLEDSHLELLTTEGFTVTERKAVLTNLIRHYHRRLQTYQGLMDLESPTIRAQYMSLLVERLNSARDSAEAELADLLREDEFLPSQPSPHKTMRTPSKNKRVFKTRDKGVLVGDLEPAQAGIPFPTMVTRNPITQQVSGRFIEHPGEGWVEVIEAPAVQPVEHAQAPSLNTLRAQSQQLIDEVAAIERSIEFQKKKLSDPTRRDELNPRDWHDMLAQQAERLETVATQLTSHHQDKPDILLTVERLRQRARELREQGIRHCIEGYKAQRPRQENIEFLRTHAAVDIGLVHAPKRTATKDFVSEFAVREKNALTVLWYAHFHYRQANSPSSEYTAAHLKRPEQRFETFKTLIEKAGADSRTIVRDLYHPITAPLDQRLFLSLLPD